MKKVIKFGEPWCIGCGRVSQDVMSCGVPVGVMTASPGALECLSIPLDKAQAGKVSNALPWCKLLASEVEGQWFAYYKVRINGSFGPYLPRIEEFFAAIN